MIPETAIFSSNIILKLLLHTPLVYIMKTLLQFYSLAIGNTSIPLRNLVYRVHELPPSMKPLVYDFGKLDDDTENSYIHQIVKNHVRIHCCNVIVIIIVISIACCNGKLLGSAIVV